MDGSNAVLFSVGPLGAKYEHYDLTKNLFENVYRMSADNMCKQTMIIC